MSVKRRLGFWVGVFFFAIFLAIFLEIDSFWPKNYLLGTTENRLKEIMKKIWNCACDLTFLQLAHFPAKKVTWSIMKSFPRSSLTNMAEGCNCGQQGNRIACLLFGSTGLKA